MNLPHRHRPTLFRSRDGVPRSCSRETGGKPAGRALAAGSVRARAGGAEASGAGARAPPGACPGLARRQRPLPPAAQPPARACPRARRPAGASFRWDAWREFNLGPPAPGPSPAAAARVRALPCQELGYLLQQDAGVAVRAAQAARRRLAQGLMPSATRPPSYLSMFVEEVAAQLDHLERDYGAKYERIRFLEGITRDWRDLFFGRDLPSIVPVRRARAAGRGGGVVSLLPSSTPRADAGAPLVRRRRWPTCPPSPPPAEPWRRETLSAPSRPWAALRGNCTRAWRNWRQS